MRKLKKSFFSIEFAKLLTCKSEMSRSEEVRFVFLLVCFHFVSRAFCRLFRILKPMHFMLLFGLSILLFLMKPRSIGQQFGVFLEDGFLFLMISFFSRHVLVLAYLFHLLLSLCWCFPVLFSSYIICVPQNASLQYVVIFDRSFMNTHILRPYSGDDFITMNGRCVSIHGRNVLTKTGFLEPRQARILMEELHYNAQNKSFRILLLDIPLEGQYPPQCKAGAVPVCMLCALLFRFSFISLMSTLLCAFLVFSLLSQYRHDSCTAIVDPIESRMIGPAIHKLLETIASRNENETAGEAAVAAFYRSLNEFASEFNGSYCLIQQFLDHCVSKVGGI